MLVDVADVVLVEDAAVPDVADVVLVEDAAVPDVADVVLVDDADVSGGEVVVLVAGEAVFEGLPQAAKPRAAVPTKSASRVNTR